MKKYKWTLEIEVQGKSEVDALERVRDRVKAFMLRGLSIEEGKISEVKE